MQNQSRTKERKMTSERKKNKVSQKEKDKVHISTAARSKIHSFTITMRSLREMAEKEAKLVQCALKDMENNLIDPKHILELTKSIHGTEERSVSEYINRNTEILLNEHASVVRQQVIENMKQQMKEMSDELTLNTHKLESNISNFFELIETSYESTADSFHKVIDLAKENYEKEEIINKTNTELFSIQSEVCKLEEQLLECLMCYAFINSVLPFAQKGKKVSLPEDFLKSFGPAFKVDDSKIIQKKFLEDIMLSVESFDPIEVHIQSAVEIMKVIDRLKDSNLSLVHNSNLSKGSLTFESNEFNEATEKMEEELKAYDSQIAAVENEIIKAKETQEKLKKQLRDVQVGDATREVQQQRADELKKLVELYNMCSGSDAKSVDIFLMKTTIDYCLRNIFQELNNHPRRKIRELIKVLEAEKKLKERKIEEALRAERLQKRLEKAKTLKKIYL